LIASFHFMTGICTFVTLLLFSAKFDGWRLQWKLKEHFLVAYQI